MKDMTDVFRFFIRKNFPKIGNQLSNEEIYGMGVVFHEHLDGKLSEEQKEKVLPKSAGEVIMKIGHPFTTNGFEPAYVLHFTQWIKEQLEEIKKEEND
jgi:hypothetical protein